MFRELQSFEPRSVQKVPNQPGIYIIYKDRQPYYVGRSRASMWDRLWKHVHKVGSRKIREALERGVKLEFEYQEMASVEQAEAILIENLGVVGFGNLRREVDPADWL